MIISAFSIKCNAKTQTNTIFERIALRSEKNCTLKLGSNSGPGRQFSVLRRLLPKRKNRGTAKKLLREKRKSKRIRRVVKKLNLYACAKKKVLFIVYGTPTKSRSRKVVLRKIKRRNRRATPLRGKALRLHKLFIKTRISLKKKPR